MNTVLFDLFLVSTTMAVLGVLFGHFERFTPKWKRLAKLTFLLVGTGVLSALIGHWSLLLFLGMAALGVAYHWWWCRQHDIDPVTAEPAEEFERLMRVRFGQADFDDLFAEVPAEQKRLFQDFLAAHPYKTLAVNGTRWRYMAAGQGAHTLLLLPGGFITADMWFHAIRAFENDYRIIAPDAYALQGIFSLDKVADALVQTLEVEGVEKATVIGLSAGGGVAQYFVQEYPEKVEHLVLSHCTTLKADKTPRLQWLVALVKFLPFGIIKRLLLNRIAATFPPSSPWTAFARAYFASRGATLRKETLVRFLESGKANTQDFVFKPEVINTWPGKALLLSSRDDALTFASLPDLQARFPDARMHVLPRGGHRAFLVYPEDYVAALSTFLDDVYA